MQQFSFNLDGDRNSIYFQQYSLSVDIIETKIFKLKISKAKRKAPTNICKISFLNKAVELINVPHIFDHSSVKPYLPTDIKFGDPTVLYWLIKSIKSKTFHFNEFVSNLNFPVFAQGNAILP